MWSRIETRRRFLKDIRVSADVLPFSNFQAAILPFLLAPALTNARLMAKQIAYMNNLRQLGAGVLIYANEYNGFMPPENAWWDSHPNAFDGNGDAVDSLALLYTKGYVKSKDVYYCPGYWATVPNFYGGPANGALFSCAQKGWGTFGHLYMGYYWHGGYNVTYAWWFQNGHRAKSLTEQIVGSPGYAVPADPARVSPLCDNYFESAPDGIYPHCIRASPRGSNHWYLDGHVGWVTPDRLVHGNNGGPVYWYWMATPAEGYP